MSLPGAFLRFLIAASLCSVAMAADTTFNRVELSLLGRTPEVPADLTLSDSDLKITERGAATLRHVLPYSQIRKISYGKRESHRILSGGPLMVLSPLAGAAVAVTKNGSHWLVIECDAQDGSAAVVLRLHKDDATEIVASVRSKIAKPVEVLENDNRAFDPAWNSMDIETVVPHRLEAVTAALRSAMGDVRKFVGN